METEQIQTEKQPPYYRFPNFFVPQQLVQVMVSTRWQWDTWGDMAEGMSAIESASDFIKDCYRPFYDWLWTHAYDAIRHQCVSYPHDAVLFLQSYRSTQDSGHPLHGVKIEKLDSDDFLSWMDKAGKWFQSRIVPNLDWTCGTVYEVYRELLCALWDMDISSTSWEGIYPERLYIFIHGGTLPLTISELRYVVENNVSREDWLNKREKELNAGNLPTDKN